MELTIIKQDGCSYIDSREVAEIVGKAHRHLLRDIRGYCGIIEKSVKPKNGLKDFFIETSYFDPIGRVLPCYLLSKKGCEMVANKLTGEKGVLFTYAYVKRFNELEAAEREQIIVKQNAPRLSEFNSAVRNVLDGMGVARATPDRVMGFLRGVYNPLGIEVLTNGDEYGYYSATEIAAALGIYSDTGRPHGHAVSAIITKLDVHAGHCVIVPYGLVGAMFRYDANVAEAVMNWLAERRLPNIVPHNGFDYHIRYNRQMSLFDEGADVDNSDPEAEYEFDCDFNFDLDEHALDAMFADEDRFNDKQ